MSQARYFEKISGGVIRHWEIERDGIRCYMSWGRVGGQARGSSITLDDEAHAKRHFKKKISEKKRQGYVEVVRDTAAKAATTAPDIAANAKLLDVMRTQAEKRYQGAWDLYWTGYEPVEGHTGVFVKFHDFQSGPGPFYDYLVLSEDERRGLHFVVKSLATTSITWRLSSILSVPGLTWPLMTGLTTKCLCLLPLASSTMCCFAPPLNGNRYGGRLGEVIPILDCEISNEDTETLVEARLRGRNSMPSTTWNREPFPVIGLSFDLRSENGFEGFYGSPTQREKTFKVYPRSMLELGIRLLSQAVPESWLKIRNYQRAVLSLTRRDLSQKTLAEIDRFLLGEAGQS